MIILPADFTDADLQSAAVTWIDLLADDPSAAWLYLQHPDNEHWTPVRLKRAIENYGAPEEPADESFFVTRYPLDEPRPYVVRLESKTDGVIAVIEADLPRNGRMSDLTAILHVVEVEGCVGLALHDLRVL